MGPNAAILTRSRTKSSEYRISPRRPRSNSDIRWFLGPHQYQQIRFPVRALKYLLSQLRNSEIADTENRQHPDLEIASDDGVRVLAWSYVSVTDSCLLSRMMNGTTMTPCLGTMFEIWHSCQVRLTHHQLRRLLT